MMAKRPHPFPYRTRKLSSSAPMVVGGCPPVRVGRCQAYLVTIIVAGWSSLVARRAHNPKVVGSNPAPATKRSRGVAVNMPACHAGDRRFDPGRDRHILLVRNIVSFFLCLFPLIFNTIARLTLYS